jgi:hypothetical protein
MRRLLKDFDPARAVSMAGVSSGAMTKSLPPSAMLHP